MKNISLNTSLIELERIGKTMAKKLKSLGLVTVYDLIFYFPFRYDDFSQTKKIKDININENISITGTIELIQNKRSFKQKKYITEALINDDSGSLKIIWFNQAFLIKNLKVGDKVSLAGKVTENFGQAIMISPQYEKANTEKKINTTGLVPIYNLSAGLTQKQLRYYISQVIHLVDKIPEWLPLNIQKNLKLLTLNQALKEIHFPKNYINIDLAKKRLEFGELFLRQLKTLIIKKELKRKQAPIIEFKEELTKNFVNSLPFTLTNDQKKAAWEIISDLKKTGAMSRLLEGDVGSGKTVVAAICILNVVANNYQAVLMAPTEILARQHYETINKLFEKEKIKISLLTRTEKTANFTLSKKKEEKIKEILNTSDIIIGTHSLLFQNHPPKLALAIIDEQHRFGVTQRHYLSNLKAENKAPHFLSLTATPIPRSLALSIYGNLDLSIIRHLPAERKAIITKIVKEKDRQATYNFIEEKIKAGDQVFVVCPLIDQSDKLGVKSVKQEMKRLKEKIFSNFSLAILHGRLKAKEKEKIMKQFLNKEINILISTSVIEVGIDVRNATIMIIEGAERFGLAQLHQFRGRVGRGDKQSYCFLFPSQENISQKTIDRLSALSKYNDGLSLAEIDLKLRGSGDLYGKLQSGFTELRLASLFDYPLIKQTRQEAEKLLETDPRLEQSKLLKEKLNNWQKNIHLE